MQSDALPKSLSVRLALALTSLIALIAAVWFATRPTPVAPEILFVGDSVTFMSGDQLSHETGSDDPIVLARVGFSTAEMLPLFEEAVAHRAAKGPEQLRQVAILIGYNDINERQPDQQAIEQFMMAADHFDCAVWLELPPVPLRELEVDRWNSRVKQVAQSHPNIHIVDDWRLAVLDAPLGELVTREDGVHPTRSGAARLAAVYVEAVHRVC